MVWLICLYTIIALISLVPIEKFLDGMPSNFRAHVRKNRQRMYFGDILQELGWIHHILMISAVIRLRRKVDLNEYWLAEPEDFMMLAILLIVPSIYLALALH